MNELFAKLEAILRASLVRFDPAWVDEAVAKAATVPHNDDLVAYARAVCAVAMEVLQARIGAQRACTELQTLKNDAVEADQRARDAAYDIAMHWRDDGIRH